MHTHTFTNRLETPALTKLELQPPAGDLWQYQQYHQNHQNQQFGSYTQ